MHSTDICFVGIDVAATTLAVCRRRAGGTPRRKNFANTSTGHRKLLSWLDRGPVRVCMEATGPYGLDLAATLHAAPDIAVMVANPRAVRDFARALMSRNKTDRVDADTLSQHAERMPFKPWTPPPQALLELRHIARHITVLTNTKAAEKNRLHAARATRTTPACVIAALDDHIAALERRITVLEIEAAHRLAEIDGVEHVLTIPGIAQKSAIQLVAELAVLPTDMTKRQWVAHAGLDPRLVESGSSINRPTRISRNGNRRLRKALYMPALAAAHRHPAFATFYQRLIAAGLTKLQALVAVMRKLLHALYAVLKYKQPFDPDKLFKPRQCA